MLFELLTLSVLGFSLCLAGPPESKLRLQEFKDAITSLKNHAEVVIDDFNDKSTKCNTLSEALQKQAMKNGYVRTAGIGLHRIFIDGKNWSEANETCHDEGGHLAVINSRAEEQLLIRMVKEAEDELDDKEGVKYYATVWIGNHLMAEKNKWVTVFGEPLNSVGYNGRWGVCYGRQQPDNHEGQENCGTLISYGVPGLADSLCSHRIGYICELPVANC